MQQVLNISPQIKGATTDPALVDGIMSARAWLPKESPRLAHIIVDVVWGANSTYGSGAYNFEFPIFKIDTDNIPKAGNTRLTQLGTAWYNDEGASFVTTNAVVYDHSDGKIKVVFTSNFWGAALPISWGAGDKFTLNLWLPIKQ